jgi:flagellar hook protein FlgE
MASSSLFTGVSGLRAYQDMLNVVGNNLANINTTAFKSQRTRFADFLYQTLTAATGVTSNRVGGTNPLQVGFGVKVNAIDQDFGQGSLEPTGGDLDMAIQGNGFFVVNNGFQDLYTRAGAFGVDEKNFLVDPASGFRVQRFGNLGEGSATSPAFQTPGDNSIKIPFGAGIPGKVTSNIVLQGNLSANASGPLAQTLTSAQPFRAGGNPATTATPLNSLDDNSVSYVAGDTLVIQGVRVDGTPVPPNTTLTLSPTSTLGDVITAINAAFPGSTASLDANGNLVLKADNTGPASTLSLVLSDAAGNTGSTQWSNHSQVATTIGKNGDTVTSAIQVFDTQGTGHTLSLTFQKTGNNTWTLSGTIPSSDGTMINGQITGITFNDDGSFRQVTGPTTAFTFQITGLSTPQTVTMNFGQPNGFTGLTQFGGNTAAAATSQDGFAAGFLTSLSVGKDGTINGVFTNGRTLSIAQIAIASFANQGGLDRQGNNFFSLSNHSGDPLIGAGLTGGRGSVQQSALESSNIDTAREFTQLIIAQRGFQVNARTITVSDQVLQELANIIR